MSGVEGRSSNVDGMSVLRMTQGNARFRRVMSVDGRTGRHTLGLEVADTLTPLSVTVLWPQSVFPLVS